MRKIWQFMGIPRLFVNHALLL